MSSIIGTAPADIPDIEKHIGHNVKRYELFGMPHIIFNHSAPRCRIKYRVFKTVATYSTPQKHIYRGKLHFHSDDQPSDAGRIRREKGKAFIELVEYYYEIGATVRGKPEVFIWNDEHSYRAMIHCKVLPKLQNSSAAPDSNPHASGQYHELEECQVVYEPNGHDPSEGNNLGLTYVSEGNVETDHWIKAPVGLELQNVQDAIDKALYLKSKTKWRYNNNKLDDEFKDWRKFFNDLSSKALMSFARYLCILNISNHIIGYFLDRIQNDNMGFATLQLANLRDAYVSMWNFIKFYSLLGTTGAVIYWGETLGSPHMLALYKTILTYSMVYYQKAHYNPFTFIREEASDFVRTIGIPEEYKPYGVECLVLLPLKPPGKEFLREYYFAAQSGHL
ncbi:hypothetical protein DFP73DRAFT_599092 [Morchella snyderi]|nr:hypothetical protein DFP73DRAFT_599092 [Morchella snyderi]